MERSTPFDNPYLSNHFNLKAETDNRLLVFYNLIYWVYFCLLNSRFTLCILAASNFTQNFYNNGLTIRMPLLIYGNHLLLFKVQLYHYCLGYYILDIVKYMRLFHYNKHLAITEPCLPIDLNASCIQSLAQVIYNHWKDYMMKAYFHISCQGSRTNLSP